MVLKVMSRKGSGHAETRRTGTERRAVHDMPSASVLGGNRADLVERLKHRRLILADIVAY